MPADKSMPRNIQDIALSNNDICANLYKRSLVILALQESIRLGLGTPLSQHLYVADPGPHSLTIFTDSQAWATKIRFQSAKILDIVRKVSGIQNPESVRVKVDPALANTSLSVKALSISPATSRLLATMADNSTDNALRSVLLKLSRNC